MFETEDRLLVQVEAFVNAQYGYDIRCEIVGESGTLTLAAPAAVRMQRDGRAGIEVPTRFQERFASAYELELRAWVGSIRDASAVGASAWDGYAAASVCEAAWESLSAAQPTAVSLESKPDLYASARPLTTFSRSL